MFLTNLPISQPLIKLNLSTLVNKKTTPVKVKTPLEEVNMSNVADKTRYVAVNTSNVADKTRMVAVNMSMVAVKTRMVAVNMSILADKTRFLADKTHISVVKTRMTVRNTTIVVVTQITQFEKSNPNLKSPSLREGTTKQSHLIIFCINI